MKIEKDEYTEDKQKDNSWICYFAVIGVFSVIFIGIIILCCFVEIGGTGVNGYDWMYQQWEADWQEYERLTGNERPVDWHYEGEEH